MTTQTFKAGDKVMMNGEPAEVTYGPFTGMDGNPRYLVKLSNGREWTTPPSALTPRPAFQVGDKVTYWGTSTGSIVAGPFVDEDSDGYVTYVIKSDDGRHDFPAPDSLSKVTEPATYTIDGKTFDLTRDVYDFSHDAWYFTGEYEGTEPLMTCRAGDSDYEDWTFSNLYGYYSKHITQPDTETVNGVTYDLSARYKDSDGDYWTFKRMEDGTVRGYYSYDNREAEVSEYSDTLEDIATDYPSLTKVED